MFSINWPSEIQASYLPFFAQLNPVLSKLLSNFHVLMPLYRIRQPPPPDGGGGGGREAIAIICF